MTRDDALTTVLAIASTLPNPDQRDALDKAVSVLRRVDGLPVDPFERAEQAAKDAEAVTPGEGKALALWTRASVYATLALAPRPLNMAGVAGAIDAGLIPGVTRELVAEVVEPVLAPVTEDDEAARLAALAAVDDAKELGDTGDEPKPRARGK